MSERLAKFFDEHNDDFLRFKDIPKGKRYSSRPDLNAFLILENIFPGRTRDLICHATHDEICLDIEPDELAAKATDEDLLDLRRCGVRYDEGNDSICMFV